MKSLIIAIVVLLLVVGAYSLSKGGDNAEKMMKKEGDSMMVKDESMMKDESMVKDGVMMEKDGEKMMESESMEKKDGETMMKAEESMMKKTGSYMMYDQSKIMASANTGDAVIFFKAGWCPTCRALDADIKANMSSIPAELTIFEADYDKEIELKKKYGVTTQHTLVQVDKDGNLITKWSGGNTLASIVSKVQ